ncbi:Uncharacterised protein [Legionella lansingensis]|uniref:Coiled-coil protein n=1 Tax=Legionella lansingensis TaxID=45067 RepID=A0A0W0VQS1_9GAMM|nr:hypothetical protein [Legionella lansingensis]KTD22054.1 hypothetical protein Llan_1317 [Legionella lansingensis]SNV54166.1 Uncharacterised protein [Legionella lansingensis]
MSDEHKEFTFLDSIDDEMHENILRLDQKLKGLQAEIAVKIDALATPKDEAASERKAQLIMLSEEVNKAIDSIKTLVNTVIAEDISPKEFQKINQETLDSLREMFKDNVDKISKIKEKF